MNWKETDLFSECCWSIGLLLIQWQALSKQGSSERNTLIWKAWWREDEGGGWLFYLWKREAYYLTFWCLICTSFAPLYWLNWKEFSEEFLLRVLLLWFPPMHLFFSPPEVPFKNYVLKRAEKQHACCGKNVCFPCFLESFNKTFLSQFLKNRKWKYPSPSLPFSPSCWVQQTLYIRVQKGFPLNVNVPECGGHWLENSWCNIVSKISQFASFLNNVWVSTS